MLYELPATCPVCQGAFHITQLECETCGSALNGTFAPNRLARLTVYQQRFIVDFLKCRGNIREMEKLCGISYPTVRARLDEIVTALGEQFGGEGTDEYAETPGDTETPMNAADTVDGAEPADAVTPVDPDGAARLSRIEILERLARGELKPDRARELLKNIF